MLFVLIVRRSVTVTTRQRFELPFACTACGLMTSAELMMEGVGRAHSVYISADADAAKKRALADGQARAKALMASCPCPKCGAIPESTRVALASWEKRAATAKKRRPYIALGLLAAAVVWAGSCSLLMIATSANAQDHGVGAGAVSSCFWVLMGLLVAGIAYAIASPPRRPNLPTTVPTNVRFTKL